ncbi:MAG: DUF2975 domain-containing protein [Oscillospiraceae bacterium]|jgi:hypothetical protein|nr:DUF2975 domain-containing protein [Oscillospiraceae bacterium]
MEKIWTPRRSVRLSLVATYLCTALLLVLIFTLPALLRWYFQYYRGAEPLTHLLLTVFYVCCPAGAGALAALARLLHNIEAGRIFVHQNVAMLRALSWACLYVTLAALIAGFFYLPLWMFAGAAGFFALILRVVKNVMAQATILREENDLTI